MYITPIYSLLPLLSIIPLEGTPDFWEAPKGLGHGDAQQAKLSQLAEEGPDCC